jgi:membrane protein
VTREEHAGSMTVGPMPTAKRSFLRKLARSVVRDAIDDVGAMMAYYATIAIFPMLLCVVTLVVLVLPEDTIADGVNVALEAAPRAVQSMVASQIDSLLQQASVGFAVATVIFAVWGASRGATGLMLALNRLFKRVETRSWLRRQVIAIAVTVGLAVLLAIAVGLLVVGPMLGDFLADRLGLGSVFEMGWTVGRWLIAALLVMVVWALAFRFLPDTDVPFRIFTPGALVGVVLWIVISRLFALFLDHVAGFGSIYGALGSTVILLTWLWLSSMSLLLAAEINAVLAEKPTIYDDVRVSGGSAGSCEGTPGVAGSPRFCGE